MLSANLVPVRGHFPQCQFAPLSVPKKGDDSTVKVLSKREHAIVFQHFLSSARQKERGIQFCREPALQIVIRFAPLNLDS